MADDLLQGSQEPGDHFKAPNLSTKAYPMAFLIRQFIIKWSKKLIYKESQCRSYKAIITNCWDIESWKEGLVLVLVSFYVTDMQEVCVYSLNIMGAWDVWAAAKLCK